MSTTTRRQQKTPTSVSAGDVRDRLKSARARNAALEKAGKLPPPTKNWSRDSVSSLKLALSARKVCCD